VGQAIMRIMHLLVALAAVCCTTKVVEGQPLDSASRSSPGSRQPGRFMFGGWAGLAQNSRAGLFGHARGRDIAIVAVQAAWTISRSDRLAVDYVVDVVPGAWESVPRQAEVTVPAPGAPCSSEFCALRSAVAGREAVYGVGAAPLGLRLRFRPHAALQPYVAASGGALWFQRPVPTPDAARFNFIADAGAGIRYARPGRLGVIAGYRLQHISNGGTAAVNPGLDGHMFYLGILHVPPL
jgi:hypothetical protein